MLGTRRKPSPEAANASDEPKKPRHVEKELVAEENAAFFNDAELSEEETEVRIKKLRERWELASVLNFLCVFEPVLGKDLKASAEEVETGLVKPNSLLSQLHIKLLKGIPPVSKKLDGSDAWVTILCKKVDPWWPWVAEGNIPLVAMNGEEVVRYKYLDAIDRLQLLRALCEIRAEQNDAVSYISDALKGGAEICQFRKEKLGGNENGTSYWYEGNPIVGHRLYRAIVKSELKEIGNEDRHSDYSRTSFQWETLATNLQEFCRVMEELASSKFATEVAVGKIIESTIVPVLEKIKKNKDRALKRKERERILNSCRNSYAVGPVRSCRSGRSISYTFDDYDRAIEEAIQVTQRGCVAEERRKEARQGCLKESASSSDSSDMGTDSDEDMERKNNPMDTSAAITENDDDNDNDGGDEKDEGTNDDNIDLNLHDEEDAPNNYNKIGGITEKASGIYNIERLSGVPGRGVDGMKKLHTKNFLRQRPRQNSALDSVIIPDSEDEDDA